MLEEQLHVSLPVVFSLHPWMATCQQLSFSNSNVATLRCKEKKCFGKGSDIKVEVKCDDELQLNHCEVNICPQNTHNAIILCGDTDREGLIETITTEDKDSTIAVTTTGKDNSTLIVVIALAALVIVTLSIALVLIATAFPVYYQRKIKIMQQMCDNNTINVARGSEEDNQDSDCQHTHTNCAYGLRLTENKLQEYCYKEHYYDTINIEQITFHTLEKSAEREVLDIDVTKMHYEISEPDLGEGISGGQEKMLENPQEV